MKVNVYVTLKPGVLDPQGKAIHHALEGLGFGGVGLLFSNKRRLRKYEWQPGVGQLKRQTQYSPLAR